MLAKMIVRDRRPVSLIHIYLDPASQSRRTVRFEVSRQGRMLGAFELVGEDIDLPDTLEQARSLRPRRWPSKRTKKLAEFLRHALGGSDSPVWLSFGTSLVPAGAEPDAPSIVAKPSGYLALVAWEMNLGRALERPVLRVQELALQPLTQRHSLSVAICCSFSAAKQTGPPDEVLETVFRQFPSLEDRVVTIHLFGDLYLSPTLHHFRSRLPKDADVRIYDPASAAGYSAPERSTDANDVSAIESPWLLWMRDSLAKTGADVVQFISHGYLGRTHGALAFAESPMVNEDSGWARFVTARQISLFLDQIGAWSAILTSPFSNFSPAGLRALQQELGQCVPGPVLLYEMTADEKREKLRTGYNYLFGVGGPPAADSLVVYTDPDWQAPLDAEGAPGRQILEEFTLAGRLRDTFERPEEVPSWVAAAQRSLERSAAKLQSTQGASGSVSAAREGVSDALRFAADLFAKYARASERESAESSGTEEPGKPE